jgi:large subunit ribosomal protein L10
MSDRRIEREVLLDYTSELFKGADFLFFTGYKGLTVKAFSELRGKLHKCNAKCVVLKKTYVRLALVEAGVEVPENFKLTGDTLCVSGKSDPCGVAKVLKEELKEYQQLASKVGVVEGKLVDAAMVNALADMPPKEVLLSNLLYIMKQPGRKLVQVLSQRKNSIVWLLENYANKLEENQ